MKLLLAKPRGFCAGVVRAVATVERALELWGPPVYVKHEIVHNQHVIEELERKGAVFVERIEQVPVGARVIYSAHGVSPEVREQARMRGLVEVDATCGLVTRVHSAVKRYAQKGYRIILIGHREHVEILGVAGEAPEVTTVVQSVQEVQALSFPPGQKLFYATQTTLSLDEVEQIVAALRRRFGEIETLPTSSLCYATTNRQMALRALTAVVDLVLVVGDARSSNSNRLREVAMARGVAAHLIHDEGGIQEEWLRGVEAIALTAGASTPEHVVRRCVEALVALGVTQVEEVIHTEENVLFQIPKID